MTGHVCGRMSEGTPGWEDVVFIRDYVRGYQVSGYG